MPGAILSLPPHYQVVFDNIWREKVSQQKEQVTAGAYVTEEISGVRKRFDQHGNQSYAMRQITARAQKTEPSDIPTGFYWVTPRPYDKTTWIDQFDDTLLGQLPDPKGMVVRNHSIASQRQNDMILFSAALGTRYAGAQGTTAVALPTTGGPAGTGQVIGVTFGSAGANSGLNLAKLTQASYLMDAQMVPYGEGTRFFGYAAKELNNLLTNVDQTVNMLYNDVRALRDGRIRDFMGFIFKMSQLVPFVSGSTTVRSCIAWHREYLLMGVGRDVATTIDRLPMQSNAWQVYTCMLMDGTRTEDEGVVQINCDESV